MVVAGVAAMRVHTSSVLEEGDPIKATAVNVPTPPGAPLVVQLNLGYNSYAFLTAAEADQLVSAVQGVLSKLRAGMQVPA